jgi:hypothetical protein
LSVTALASRLSAMDAIENQIALKAAPGFDDFGFPTIFTDSNSELIVSRGEGFYVT